MPAPTPAPPMPRPPATIVTLTCSRASRSTLRPALTDALRPMKALVPRGIVCVWIVTVDAGCPVEPPTPFAGVFVVNVEFAELAVDVMLPLFGVVPEAFAMLLSPLDAADAPLPLPL